MIIWVRNFGGSGWRIPVEAEDHPTPPPPLPERLPREKKDFAGFGCVSFSFFFFHLSDTKNWDGGDTCQNSFRNSSGCWTLFSSIFKLVVPREQG